MEPASSMSMAYGLKDVVHRSLLPATICMILLVNNSATRTCFDPDKSSHLFKVNIKSCL